MQISLITQLGYLTYKHFILNLPLAWWTGTYLQFPSGLVCTITKYGYTEWRPPTEELHVRPLLIFDKPSLMAGMPIRKFDLPWMALTDTMALCEQTIGKSIFDPDPCVHKKEELEIQKYLNAWLYEKINEHGE